MTGSSIAGRDAAVWVTDFLNTAYYRRSEQERDVDDLRLAFCVLTTYWYRKPGHGRLHDTDLPAFHRAFGAERFATGDSGRGTLSRAQLLDGAARLLDDWFPAAYADDARRGWGIAFETAADRAAYDPDSRMKLAKWGKLTPESAPASEQTWHTYPLVRMPSAEAVIAVPTAPETGPDYASESADSRRCAAALEGGRRRNGEGEPEAVPEGLSHAAASAVPGQRGSLPRRRGTRASSTFATRSETSSDVQRRPSRQASSTP